MKKILLIVMFIFINMTQYLCARTIIVNPTESIQKAIISSHSGDTIEINRSIYQENLIIDKPLIIKGINRPTITANGKNDVIRIRSSNVKIEGLIVYNSGDNLTDQNAGIFIEPKSNNIKIYNCDITYNLFGIWAYDVINFEVKNNLIVGKRDYISVKRGNGIQLIKVKEANIEGNNIAFTRDGIYVDVTHHSKFIQNIIHNVRYGTHYMNSYYNTWEENNSYHNRGGLALMEVRNQVVRNNKAWGNSDHGIMLRTIQDSVVEGNLVAYNRRGFFIYDAEYNTLKNNTISNNYVGLHVWAGSINNKIGNNNIIHNKEQIRYVSSKNQYWDENYWSNYTGWDRNKDGIGDIEYIANDVIDKIMWRNPSAKLLINSPAVQTLKLIAEQFPILKVSSIIDRKPRIDPINLGQLKQDIRYLNDRVK